MAGGVSEPDHAAKRHAQDYRTGDAQDIAERAHVIAPLRQIPAFPGTVLASTIASMIQIDDLNDISQGRVCRLVDRVVEAGPAMKQQQCRLFSHHGTVRHQLRALNVEEKPHPIDEHLHGVTPWIRDRSGQPSRLRVWYGYRTLAMKRADWALVTFLAHSISQCVPLYVCRFRCHADFVVRPECHPDFMELQAPRRWPRCWRLVRRLSRNPTMPTRKCGFSSLRISCGNSPARMKSCNTATGSSKSA